MLENSERNAKIDKNLIPTQKKKNPKTKKSLSLSEVGRIESLAGHRCLTPNLLILLK